MRLWRMRIHKSPTDPVSRPRIVSLVPAATEWLTVLGADDLLVGRTAACIVPAAHPVPVVEGHQVAPLAPSVVIYPSAPLSPHGEAIQMTWAPRTMRTMLTQVLHLARHVGRLKEAMQWIGQAEATLHQAQRLRGVHKRMASEDRPCVAVQAPWTQEAAPPWLSDLIDLAGGQAVQDLETAVEVVVLLDAGVSAQEQAAAWTGAEGAAGPTERPPVVLGLNGHGPFHRAGPRLYEATQALLAALHPHESEAEEAWRPFVVRV